MTSYQIPLTNSSGVDEFRTLSFYGMNVTVADVIMSDGKRLENVGVSPDYAVGPTSEALAQRADPVLAFAAGLMGVKITPAEAGKLQFLFKKQEIADDDDDKDDGKEKN
jgi:C-terminal processing protease CtpA/Prc